MTDVLDQFGKNVTLADMEAVKRLRGLFSNRVFVQLAGNCVRVNLGELISNEPIYHTAVVFDAVEALGYAELIKEMAERAIYGVAAAAETPEMIDDGQQS